MDSQPHSNRKRFIAVALIVLVGVVSFVVSSLLLGVIGGFILWAMSRGIFEWFERKMKKRRTLAAGLSVLTLFLLVVGPVITILILMVNSAVDLAHQGVGYFNHLQPHLERLVDRFSSSGSLDFFGYELDAQLIVTKLQEFSGTAAKYLVKLLQKTAGGVFNTILQVFVMLYTLFFCYLDGDKFVNWFKKLLPLTSEESDKLLQNFFATAITSLKALGIIGLVQGVLGGVAFWVCGIPSPFFWTVLLILATVIPVFGAQLFTIPAAIFLMLSGDLAFGIGLLLWSTIVIANVDNLLRPYLVGREVQLHELVVFLTTIGGLAVFGFWGFLIGPVIAALLKAVSELYVEASPQV
ncbi:MAG: AI-2E family transporter [Calditrichaeota bacterium]|nr:AI-2E family transporter [Calditrichota bacterium]MCB9391414.1 AI-2E family transporter [Calditrichota bacterium]